MIKVCDAIMGSGKTSACIEMMNANPTKKYIFITPYLDEAARIKEACPELNFVEPSNKLSQFNFKKIEHTNELIQDGRNITTTHQAFLFYTEETLDLIKKHGYTLVIDESVSVLESTEVSDEDIRLLASGGYLQENNGIYSWTGKEYGGARMRDIMRIARSRDMVCIKRSGKVNFEMFYWILPAKLITAFSEVIIMTYLFTGQPLYYFIKMNGLPYEYIGINRRDGRYAFCEYPGYEPEYTKDLHNRVHVIDDDKLNDIGNDYYALSMQWFDTHDDDIEQLKKNIYNYFRNKVGFIPAEQRMWGSHKKGQNILKGPGYSKSFLTFNARAVNEYRNRTCLVYAINVFMNVGEKIFYKSVGIEVDEDTYALSTMIQWIWRSAIRDGHEIYIYVPSKRMRELLLDWVQQVSGGGDYAG